MEINRKDNQLRNGVGLKSSKPLAGKSNLVGRKSISRGGTIRAAKPSPRLLKYKNLVEIEAKKQARCAVCKFEASGLDPHHPAGRLGDNLFNFVMVHRQCHRWIHANPKEAKKLGLLKRNMIPNE